MDYEKKYKESLALMVDYIPDEDGYVHVRPQDIFSELCESEDERIRKAIISIVAFSPEAMFDRVSVSREDCLAWLENLNVADNDILLKDVDWLKSLRPKNTWKPSDEQMNALQTAIGIVGELTPTALLLKEIREQLKKLREG